MSARYREGAVGGEGLCVSLHVHGAGDDPLSAFWIAQCQLPVIQVGDVLPTGHLLLMYLERTLVCREVGEARDAALCSLECDSNLRRRSEAPISHTI